MKTYGPQDERPWDPLSGRTMTVEELLKASSALRRGESMYQQAQFAPSRFGIDVMSTALKYGTASAIPMRAMPAMTSPLAMMTGTQRVRVTNLAGSREDLAWFEANRLQLAAQYPGQFLVIKDQAVRGAYPDFQAAYNAGVALFGTQSFEVKQAVGEQRAEYA